MTDPSALETALFIADPEEWEVIWGTLVQHGVWTGDAEIEHFRKLYPGSNGSE